MIEDDFLNSLGNLLKYKIDRFLRMNVDYSLYGDLWSVYEAESEEEFCSFKKRYINDVGNAIKLNAFDTHLTDIQFDIGELENGEVLISFMLDVAKLFEDYDEKFTLPFYTMLNVQLNYQCYKTNDDSFYSQANKKCRFKTDLDKGLLNRTSQALLNKAITSLNGELTFGAVMEAN